MSIIEKALNKADQQESGSDAAADLSADVQPVAYGNADMPPDKPMSTSNDLGFRKGKALRGLKSGLKLIG